MVEPQLSGLGMTGIKRLQRIIESLNDQTNEY